MSTNTRKRAFQFSLAWLIFWTFVCALAVGIGRSMVEHGEEGWDNLLLFGTLTVWLMSIFVAVYLRIFLQRRWDRSAAMRQELERLVSDHKAQRDADRPATTSSPSREP